MKKTIPAFLLILLAVFLVPINTNAAASTLSELRQEVEEFTDDNHVNHHRCCVDNTCVVTSEPVVCNEGEDRHQR